ncbi:prolyl oligopeptidase family serine peptidase [Enterococcus sp. BWB1-3]|uniref:alpha/beta hydrolase family protein n=1 Tax=Enterococcus sp. BWB1-3 TaxID=2787713 RepID=UPI00192104E5|nr:prolyl oligopeptidase family serine peptidase [Enterococcus sp. BWB1-3]MBL1229270.1 prolyl oligopeptidase family serine peptidase [Enterococcus sp. BWB1-3]
MKKFSCMALLFSLLLITACSSESGKGQSFKEAHDAFETKLIREESDQNPVPEPPAGVFDLVYYDSEVGKLAAYVSSDPGENEKRPMMIWVTGGWGNGLDEIAWSYPDWENDQTASAFREAGILMMYPSFRGGSGNPGNYETLFGEVNDIVSAYEYAASLPYVDPDRIYLGGHSTGGTRALLASEYTDQFRAVFSFGPVDDVSYHNASEFTFDTENKEEYRLRSPIHWLSDIKSPTFVIEGSAGNASNLKEIERQSKNENLQCFIVEDADHFSVLAPVTRLFAQKVIKDTGVEPDISLTEKELQTAMKQVPEKIYPLMKTYRNEMFGFGMEIPAIWEVFDESEDEADIMFASAYEGDNFWEASLLFSYVYEAESAVAFSEFIQYLNSEGDQYEGSEIDINGQKAFSAECLTYSSGISFYSKVIGIQKNGKFYEFWFDTPEEFWEDASIIFEQVIESITLK